MKPLTDQLHEILDSKETCLYEKIRGKRNLKHNFNLIARIEMNIVLTLQQAK